MSAVNATVYPDRVHLVEVSPWQHREELLTAAATDRTGARLAEQVASWLTNTDAVYLSEVGDAAALAAAVRAAVGRLDPAPAIRTSGRAEDHVVGDVPVGGGKVVRPADEAAVVMGEAPEGAVPLGADPSTAKPLLPKPLPAVEDSLGTTHAHHVGGSRLREADADALPASDAPVRGLSTIDPQAAAELEPAQADLQATPVQTTTPGGSALEPVTEDEAAADPRTQADLRDELEEAGLPVSGTKREQLQRLRDAGA